MEDNQRRREEAIWGEVSGWEGSLFADSGEGEARKWSHEAVGRGAEAEDSYGVAWAISPVQTGSRKGEQKEKVKPH